MLNTIRSEWTKLTSTKALYWNTFVLFLLTLTFAAIEGYFVKPDPILLNLPILHANKVLVGLNMLGMFVISIQAIMVVTAEYRHDYASVTFTATPKRVQVAVAKWLVTAMFIAFITFTAMIVSLYTAKLLGGSEASATLRVWEDDIILRLMWLIPLKMVLVATLSQGVAWLLKQTAGAVSLMALWMLMLENILGLLPKVGEKIVQFGPFSNLVKFENQITMEAFPYGGQGSGWYFAGWAFAMLGIGIVVMMKKDA
ncbi:multidrug ABC transporter permease [Corynebacterium sp. HS2168-gen11]|uniref:multidrug ABC transporter permease n=1 Tax=Corynebacterium sp. HS2168-gen11 TaxID=2974027 RepID=UPI00216B5C50|nr:multidrug ABC transporter permease [Corynebacterium sp. HS2168-gen11]MCS4536141.1 multidrug ABC transporter permease [Corynebacterium sp. HS2168-gen11]